MSTRGPVVWGAVPFRVWVVKTGMAGGLPKGKSGLRDSCPWWRVFFHSQPWRVDVIPGKGSGNLLTESTWASGLGMLA